MTMIIKATKMIKAPRTWVALAGGFLVAIAPEIGELANWGELHEPGHVARMLFALGGGLTTHAIGSRR